MHVMANAWLYLSSGACPVSRNGRALFPSHPPFYRHKAMRGGVRGERRHQGPRDVFGRALRPLLRPTNSWREASSEGFFPRCPALTAFRAEHKLALFSLLPASRVVLAAADTAEGTFQSPTFWKVLGVRASILLIKKLIRTRPWHCPVSAEQAPQSRSQTRICKMDLAPSASKPINAGGEHGQQGIIRSIFLKMFYCNKIWILRSIFCDFKR